LVDLLDGACSVGNGLVALDLSDLVDMEGGMDDLLSEQAIGE
jgi:hypothetical protein